MKKILDKLIILAVCTPMIIFYPNDYKIVLILLISVFLSSLISIFNKPHLTLAVSLLYFIATFFAHEFYVFLPLFIYDILYQKNNVVKAIPLIPIFLMFLRIPFNNAIFHLSISFLSVYIFTLTYNYAQLNKRHREVRDSEKERSINLERKNRELIERQDYETNLATLTERNRIAREIHDNVGHLLTRSLMQISALQVVHKDNEKLIHDAAQLKTTLSSAMDNVRQSVHKLHDDSINFHVQIQTIIENYTFCVVKHHYKIEDENGMDKDLKYTFSAIVREAFSNTAKHSNATEINLYIIEHPGIYQLKIEDNGSRFNPPKSGKEGIGLINMKERVAAFGGIFNAEFKNGFKIFISIPKEKRSD